MRRAVIAICALLAACTESAPLDEPVLSRVELKLQPVITRPAFDVLFVIDNSPSMADEQTRLIASYPRFIDILMNYGLGTPDVHVGVVSTDPADQGRVTWLVDIANNDESRTKSYSGSLADAFTRMATLGTGGNEPQALEALALALEDPANDGFMRRDATLVAVVITDDDDRSDGDIAAYASRISAAKHDTKRAVMIAARASAPRFVAFVEHVERAYLQSIERDLLELFAGPFTTPLIVRAANPCFERRIDPATCAASDISAWGTTRARQEPLRPCLLDATGHPGAYTPVPCWYIGEDRERCAPYPTAKTFLTYPQRRHASYQGTAMLAECVIVD